MNDSNGDDYSTDFEPHHVPSRNHEHIKRTESQESVEIEIRLSDSRKIKGYASKKIQAAGICFKDSREKRSPRAQ